MFFRLSQLLKGFLEGFGIKFIGIFVAECSYLSIQQITVVIALFFKMIVKSAVYDSRGTISESFVFFEARVSMITFGVEQIKVSFFGQRFQQSIKIAFHVTRMKYYEYRIFLKKLQFHHYNRNLRGNVLPGRSKL